MAVAQPGIFAQTTAHQYALEYALLPSTDVAHIRQGLAQLVCALRGRENISHVIAFGPGLCESVGATPTTRSFSEFEAIHGLDDKQAPATQHDLLIWLHGIERDQLFDAAREVDHILHPVMACQLEIPGFVRHESRDLTGFVDGSANPTGDLIMDTALIPGDQPDNGGSFVLTQKWQHDLESFGTLSINHQEKVIGRTKADSIELEGDDMPVDSHVSRTDVSVDGETQRIYRRSFPYGTLDDHGLYFLAFAHDQSRFDLQLKRMYGVTEDGIRDRITDFSTALTGSYFFAPSNDCLDGITE